MVEPIKPQQPLEKNIQSPKGPALRTMKSDLEELTKSTVRPPALTTASENLEAKTKTQGGTTLTVSAVARPKPSRAAKKVAIFISAGTFLILLLAVGLYFYSREETVQVPQVTTPPPPPQQAPVFFATEASITLTLTPQDRQGFLRALEKESSDAGRPGTVKRLTVKLLDGPQERLLTLADFLEILESQPPPQLLENMDPYVSLFVFYGGGGGRIGLVAKTRDGNRALRDLYLWENTLWSSFQSLFFGKEQDIKTDEFKDRIYKNIDWRFLGVSSQEDLGIGYTVFPARGVLIITTGREAMETIISRLLNEG